MPDNLAVLLVLFLAYLKIAHAEMHGEAKIDWLNHSKQIFLLQNIGWILSDFSDFSLIT